MDSTVPPLPPRLTLRFILLEMAERFFNFERGWLRTAKELFTQPGAMIRRYVERDRKSYANPLSYLVLTSALSFLVQEVTGFDERLVTQLLETGADKSPGQYEFARQLTELVFQNLLYVSFLILVPFAVLLRWFFRRSGFNLAESFVFAFFTGGHAALLGLVMIFLFLAFPIHPHLYSALGMALGLAYYSYAARGFYGGWIATFFKTCLAFLISYALLFLLVVIGTVVYIVGFQPSFASGEAWTMVKAAEENALHAAQTLLEEGADVEQTSDRTPLHVAAMKGYAEMVDLLLANGADPNAQDHLGRVPMFLALVHGHEEIAERLASAGTDATVRTLRGETLLIAALRRKNVELARWSLEHGVDVNAVRTGSRRVTALMVAADLGELGLVELLLENGADPSLTNEDGETALDVAGNKAVAARLRSASSP